MLKDKTAIITGSNRGLGKAILTEFAKNHANIYAHARKQSEEFEKFLKDLSEKYNVNIEPVYFDMTDTEAMKTNIKNVIKSKQKIDILVNNAGIASVSMFNLTPISKIKEIFEVNFFAQMELTQLVLRSMTRNQSGSIVNIGSVTALITSEGQISYATSKMALMTWAKNIAAEYSRFNIRSNSVAFGLIKTDMYDKLTEEELEYFRQRTLLKRVCTPEEGAKVVRFLASDDASFINGQIIRVDGGML